MRFLLIALFLGLATSITSLAHGHGFASTSNLPVPAFLYWYGGATVVALSFLLISIFIRRTSTSLSIGRRDLLKNGLVRKVVQSRTTNILVKLPGVAALFLVITTGLLGNQSPVENFAPTFVWVIWWIGFGFIHALVGNVWSVLNPWKSLYELALFPRGGHEPAHVRPYPNRLGLWPAFVVFFSFVWIELIFPGSASPRNLALLALVYSFLTWTGMWLFGKDVWLRHGEAFAVFFRFLASFAPTEIRNSDAAICERCPIDCHLDGECINCTWCSSHSKSRQLNLRTPAMGLIRREVSQFDHVAFVLLMLSSVTFDGISRTLVWYGFVGVSPFTLAGRALLVPINTFGLIGIFLFILGTYYVFMYLVKRFSGTALPTRQIALLFVLSLLPIAMVYQFAHYSTFLFINGQFIIRLLSDPFGFNWNIFGTSNFPIFTALDFLAVWHYQVALIVAGHIIGVYLAHQIALRTFGDHRSAIRSQYPLMLLMVIYTGVGLWLLSAPTIG